MPGSIVEFTASGSPGAVSGAIEEHAKGHGSLSAIVVPWESDPATLSMAVTSVTGDGWAIEHTNLGTIRLTDLGHDRTHVVISPDQPDHPEHLKLSALFDGFARQVQRRFQVAS